MKPAFLSVIGLGLLLLVLSGLWRTLFPGTSSWTPDKSAEWTKIKDRIHTLGFIVAAPPGQVSMHGGTETGQAKAELDRLKEQHAVYSAEFTSAHDRPYTVARILKWSGISLALVGIVGWYAVNQSR